MAKSKKAKDIARNKHLEKIEKEIDPIKRAKMENQLFLYDVIMGYEKGVKIDAKKKRK